MLTDFKAAVEWLESQYEYQKDDFRHPLVRSGDIHPDDQYSSYMANIKCECSAHPSEYCGSCHRRSPLYVTSVPWTADDDLYWLKQEYPGRYQVLQEISRRYYNDRSHPPVEYVE